MTRQEVIKAMTVIKTAYPMYYKSQTEINDAVNLWTEMLSGDDPNYMAKAIKDFIKNDTSSYPPNIAQIRSIARDFRLKDIDERKNKQFALEEPNNSIAMPDYIRDKLNSMFRL